MNTNPKWTHKFEIKPDSWVFVPSDFSVQEGKNIKEQIEKKWQPSAAYYHLKAGGHVAALKSHMKNKYFLRLDIENFFGSINRSRITRTLKPYFSYETAREIAVNSTVVIPNSFPKKYMLPFGFIQSPILASICLEKSSLGKFSNSLLGQSGVTVTIYMDDIIISTNDNELLMEISEKIKTVSNKSGFGINPRKQEGPSEQITAFNIKLSHKNLEISDDRMIEFLFAYKNSESYYQKKGIASYVGTVNPLQAEKFD